MLAWLKKIFSSKQAEEMTPAAPAETPAALKTPAESLTGAEEAAPEATEEASSEDMK